MYQIMTLIMAMMILIKTQMTEKMFQIVQLM